MYQLIIFLVMAWCAAYYLMKVAQDILEEREP